MSGVLVVGAGPTGLTLALDLAKKQIPFRIIDKLTTANDHSRAFGIHAGCLAALRAAFGPSLPDALVAAGRPVRHVTAHLQGAEPITIPFAIDAQDPFLLLLPQAETERILREHLVLAGHGVEWGQELTGFTQDAHAITATISGRTSTHTYLAGCDGAHSSARHLFGTRFEGHPYEGDFMLADVDVEWSHADGHVHAFIDDTGAVAAFPFHGKRQRLFLIERDPAAADAPCDEAGFTAGVRKHVGEVGLGAFRYLTRFRLHHRLAETWRTGRAFLLGDAAHIHSPIGGQGMNLGMQDALVLGHVLAGATQHEVDLDVYERLRKPIARGVLRGTDLVFRQGLGPANWLNRLVRHKLAPSLLRSSWLVKAAIPRIAQLRMAADVIAFRERAI